MEKLSTAANKLIVKTWLNILNPYRYCRSSLLLMVCLTVTEDVPHLSGHFSLIPPPDPKRQTIDKNLLAMFKVTPTVFTKLAIC